MGRDLHRSAKRKEAARPRFQSLSEPPRDEGIIKRDLDLGHLRDGRTSPSTMPTPTPTKKTLRNGAVGSLDFDSRWREPNRSGEQFLPPLDHSILRGEPSRSLSRGGSYRHSLLATREASWKCHLSVNRSSRSSADKSSSLVGSSIPSQEPIGCSADRMACRSSEPWRYEFESSRRTLDPPSNPECNRCRRS